MLKTKKISRSGYAATLLGLLALTGCKKSEPEPIHHSSTYDQDYVSINWASPSHGSAAGGTQIFIFGGRFQPGATVTLGGAPCGSVDVNSYRISCITPPGVPGQSTLVVRNPNGRTATSWQIFSYDRFDPSIHTVSPASGPLTGGNRINVFGNHFSQDMQVRIGAYLYCTDVIVHSPTHLSCSVSGGIIARTENLSILRNYAVVATAYNAYSYNDTQANIPTIQSTMPSRGLNHVATQIYIFGRNLNNITQVKFMAAGVTHFCGGLSVQSSSQLVCTLPALDYVGAVTFQASTGGGIWFNFTEAEYNFLAEHRARSEQDNPNTISLIHESYAGSEAEMLRRYFDIRSSQGNYIDSVNHRGQNIEIYSTPNEMTRGYIINSEEIARQSGVPFGTVLSEAELQEMEFEQMEVIINAPHPDVTVNQFAARNPIFNPRTISAEKEQDLARIRGTVEQRLVALNQGITRNHFVDSAHINVNAVYTQGEDRDAFTNILNSIRDGNEENFISSIVRFGTFFPANKGEARRGFLDTFTHLYVTKHFPSEGIMLQYLHFILRCGQLY